MIDPLQTMLSRACPQRPSGVRSANTNFGGGSVDEGSVLLFVSGSTAGLTTVEYEPGLLRDVPAFFERIIPQDAHYHHEDTWHDGNGHSHVRASLLGPSLVVPFEEGRLTLGTWQQVVFLDFDNGPRERELVLQFQGC